MCGVIVVDAESFWSTNLGRDDYLHDHRLGYCHDYSHFYQLPNNNLFTQYAIFLRESSSEKYAPWSISYHIKLKIPCCDFSLFILFYVLIRSIYQSL